MKKKTFYAILAVVMIVIFVLIYITIENKNKDKYYFKDNSFSYSQSRGNPVFIMTLKEQDGNLSIYRVDYESRNFVNYNTKIYGLFIIPTNAKNVPGLVLLPGGSVTKESESVLGSKIARLGYAVLTYDQRGIGETGGYYLSLEEDYKVFSRGNEPVQHLSVYDALKAYDILREIESVDDENIGIAGESMGGRYAIVTAAIDKRIKGAIVISSSGFHIKDEKQPYSPYLLSVDPDNYIGKISPNPVYMLHSLNDSMIKLEDAKITFNLANEPKNFFQVDKCAHGYCDAMYDELKKDLAEMFGK